MSFKEKFKVFPTLKTERLTLRELSQEDVNAFQIINSDSDVLRFMAIEGQGMTIEETSKWIDTMNSRFYKHRSAFVWAIALNNSDRAIGYIECTNFVRSSMTDIAYYLSKDYWNQGIMSEAIKEVIKFGFNFVGFHRIQATVAVENKASIRTLIKLGFTNEGVLRKYMLGKEFRDVAMLSILSKDIDF
ncbi:GNAT family protein [Paenibacillus polygoni]|uniref:GNAT family protein n=1 Tax=Paenibacillus polygoni TaxID=3050112 RepID=A0ABY8X7Q1_9BACL|nr:GNAT family protein [Paenibacillus polygoni]WIV21154.1 GNAT family protein [Paenibacillus polygoni]